MGWSGALFGAWVGSRVSGALGALIGGVLGHFAQRAMNHSSADGGTANDRRRGGSGRVGAQRPLNERQLVFCASASAMLAKLAKADGQVTREEIAAVERAFARLGFAGEVRRYCVKVFQHAKSDQHTIYEYALEFAAIVESVETRELLYELLWELAAADGVISAEERRIMQLLPRPLGIRPDWYGFYASRYGSTGGASRPTEENPYDVLGVPRDCDYETARAAYRQAAKRYHPDLLRAQGVPEEMIGKATEKMARINAAWDRIEAAAR